MKAIINNKIYDTEKAEKIKTYYRTFETTGFNILGQRITGKRSRECIIYKTKKGAWFEHRLEVERVTNVEEEIVEVTESDVRNTFKEIGDVENYQKYFEKLEEA